MTLTSKQVGRTRRNNRKNNIGSVSCATMRPEDLIPSFLLELKGQKPLQKEHRKLIGEISENMRKAGDDSAYFESEDATWDLEALFDALNEYCLPYFYFGAHPGDGSDYGYWLSDDFRQQFEDDGGLVVNDTADIPKGYAGEVLHVSDHGNMTLYVVSRGKLRECWAIV